MTYNWIGERSLGKTSLFGIQCDKAHLNDRVEHLTLDKDKFGDCNGTSYNSYHSMRNIGDIMYKRGYYH